MRLLLCECTRSEPVVVMVVCVLRFGADVPSDVFLSFSLGVVALLLLVISFQYIQQEHSSRRSQREVEVRPKIVGGSMSSCRLTFPFRVFCIYFVIYV